MPMTPVVMRATYEDISWEGENEEPNRETGFTDPRNPYGGFKSELPPQLCGDKAQAWMDANVQTVEFDTLWEAAEFVVDFEGDVWDFREGASPSENYQTGVNTSVRLHVDTHQEGVFAIASWLQRQQDKHLRELREQYRDRIAGDDYRRQLLEFHDYRETLLSP